MMTYLKSIKKEDWISLSIIWVLFIFMICISYARWGNPIVDCFRNAYVPDEIMAGNILYKDVYFFYGPLIVYFHALLFKIFGINLQVLYTSGIIVSFIIINTIYYLSRQLLKPFLSCIFGSMFLILVVFRPGIFQYIFPYSYEALYGLLFLLFILVCLINIIKKDFKSSNLLYIAAILVSICSIIKQDVAIIAYGIFYLYILAFLVSKKLKIADIIKPILITILLPLIIYGLLTIIIPINQLIDGLIPTNRFNLYYLKNYSTMGLSLNFLFLAFKTFLLAFLAFTSTLSLAYFLVWLIKKANFTLKIFFPVLIIFTCICISYFHELIINCLVKIPQFNYGWFEWGVAFLFIFLIFFGIHLWKTKKEPAKKDLYLLIFTVSAIIFLFRNPLTVNLQSVNNFFVFPALLVVFYIISSIIPESFINVDNQKYTLAFAYTIIILSFLILLTNYNLYHFKNVLISNDRGKIYLSPIYGVQIQKTLAFIEKYSTQNDKIFSPPEDLIYNFMTGRQGSTKFYQLVPGMVKTIQEEKQTIEDIKRNNTKLILVSTNDNVKRYGKTQWGIDFNTHIFKWITDNYLPLTIADNYFPNSNVQMPYKVIIFINKKNYKPLVPALSR